MCMRFPWTHTVLYNYPGPQLDKGLFSYRIGRLSKVHALCKRSIGTCPDLNSQPRAREAKIKVASFKAVVRTLMFKFGLHLKKKSDSGVQTRNSFSSKILRENYKRMNFTYISQNCVKTRPWEPLGHHDHRFKRSTFIHIKNAYHRSMHIPERSLLAIENLPLQFITFFVNLEQVKYKIF